MRVRRIAAITAAGLAVIAGAGVAISATAGDDAKRTEDQGVRAENRSVSAEDRAVRASEGRGVRAGGRSARAEDRILRDAARELNVRPSELREALRNATAAHLDRELDRAVRAGKLTRKQADEIKSRHKASGRVLGLGAPHARGVGPRHGFRHGGPGFRRRHGGGGGPLDALAKALGISRGKLLSDLRDGKTIAEIAKGAGKSLAQVKEDLLASAKARLDRAVKDGHLTRRQAGAMLDRIEDRLDRLDSARPFGPPGGHGGPGGPGFDRSPDGMRR